MPVLLREQLVWNRYDENVRIVIIVYLIKKSFQCMEPGEAFDLVQFKLRLRHPQQIVCLLYTSDAADD